jgi:hypothetical protein
MPQPKLPTASAVLLMATCVELPRHGSVRRAAFSRQSRELERANYTLNVLLDDSKCPGACELFDDAMRSSGSCLGRSDLGSATFFAPFDGYPVHAIPPGMVLDGGGASETPWWFSKFWTWEHGLHLALAARPELRRALFLWLLESDITYNGDWGELLWRYDTTLPTTDLVAHSDTYACTEDNKACYDGGQLSRSRMGNLLGTTGANSTAGFYKVLLFASRLSRRLVAAGAEQFSHGKVRARTSGVEYRETTHRAPHTHRGARLTRVSRATLYPRHTRLAFNGVASAPSSSRAALSC